MAVKNQKGVVSGPDRQGRWYWRPLKSAEASQPVDPDHTDPGWVSGQTAEMRVRRTFKGLEILGPVDEPPRPAPDDPVLLNGEPLDLSWSHDLEPGTVVTAEVPFSARDPGDPGVRRNDDRL